MTDCRYIKQQRQKREAKSVPQNGHGRLKTRRKTAGKTPKTERVFGKKEQKIMRVKSGLLKKVLALLLALVMTLSLIPISALADSITFKPRGMSGYNYYYNGNGNIPTPDGVSITGPRYNGTSYPTATYDTVVKQYQLGVVNSDATIDTYCSDLAVLPKKVEEADFATSDYMYRRIQIEELASFTDIVKDSTFFKASALSGGGNFTVDETAAKLRAILMNSNLWFDKMKDTEKATALNAFAVAAGFNSSADFSTSDMVVATQLAVWRVVNGAIPMNISGNVSEIYDYLINIDPIYADEMARLKPVSLTKTTTQTGASTYQAVVEFEIDGHGAVGPVNFGAGGNASIGSIKYKLPGEAAQIIASEKYEVNGAIITVRDIPAGAELMISVSVNVDVNSVYLYVPRGGRGTSQTLVSVESEKIPLATDVTISAPSNLAQLSFGKRWVTEAGYPLANNVVATDYTSNIEIYLVKEGNVFNNIRVASYELKGNQRIESTGYMFEDGNTYKVVETSASALAGIEAVMPTVTEKYFTIELNSQQNYVTKWVDADGDAVPGETGTFTNVAKLAVGAIRVTKTVDATGAVVQPADTFTFTATYTENAVSVLYKDAPYTIEGSDVILYTNSEGEFNLSDGQTAIFNAIPVGASLTVVEAANSMYDTTVSPTNFTAVADKDTPKTIAYTNSYKTGSLTISKDIKNIDNNGSVSWNNFPNKENGIVFTIEGTDSTNDHITKTVTLYKDHISETVTGLPVGNYTVTENQETAQQSGYVFSVNNDGELTAEVKQTETPTALFTNTYARGSVRITKLVDIGDDVTDDELGSPTYTFTLWKKADTGDTYSIVSVDGENSFTLLKDGAQLINNLAPGTYKLVEDLTAAAPASSEVRFTTELDAPDGNTTPDKVGADHTFTVGNGFTGTIELNITNKYRKTSAELTISKEIVVDGVKITGDALKAAPYDNLEFTVNAVNGGKTVEFVLNAENNWQETKEVPPGTYIVTEVTPSGIGGNYSGADIKYDDQSAASKSVTLQDLGTASVKVTNTYTRLKSSVSFKKIVPENRAYGDTFTFDVDFDESLTKYKSGVTVTVGGVPSSALTWNTDNTKLTISGVSGNAAGIEVVINGLPVGVTVTVTENLPDDITYYTTTYSKSPETVENALQGVVASTLLDLGAITNTRAEPKNLVLTKVLDGITWDKLPDDTVEFTVVGPAGWADNLINGTTVIGTKGETTATVKVPVGGITLTNIPSGKYTVTEVLDSVNVTVYTLTSTLFAKTSDSQKPTQFSGTSSRTVTITLNGTDNWLWVKNAYTRKTGSGEFTKSFDEYGPIVGKYEFRVDFFIDEDCEIPVTENLSTVVNTTGLTNPKWADDGKSLTFDVVFAQGDTANKKVTIANIPDGLYIKITETGAPDGFATQEPTIHRVVVGTPAIISIENTRSTTGKLDVTKALGSNPTTADATTAFVFKLWINGNLWKQEPSDPSTGEFTLKPGETARFTGLPVGVSYRVEEVGPNSSNYTSVVTGAAAIGITSSAEPVPEITFTNTHKTGELSISKTVVDNTGGSYAAKSYEFTVTFSDTLAHDYTIEGGTGGSGTITGTSTITLAHNQTAVFTGIHYGVGVTVTENYTLSADAQATTSHSVEINGTIKADKTFTATIAGDTTAAFKNTFNTMKANLTVTKLVKDSDGNALATDGNFKMRLLNGDTPVANRAFTSSITTRTDLETDETGYFNISKDETITFAGIDDHADNVRYYANFGIIDGDLKQGFYGTFDSGTGENWVKINRATLPYEINPGDATVDKGTLPVLVDPNVPGVYSFTLKHDGVLTISNLPIGVTYTITEVTPADHNGEAFNMSKSGVMCKDCDEFNDCEHCEGLVSTGAVIENEKGSFAAFKNAYDAPKGQITVTKVWANAMPANASIKVTLLVNGAPDTRYPTVTLNGTPDSGDTNNKGWSYTFTGLDLDKTYKVIEEHAYANYTITIVCSGGNKDSNNNIILDYGNRIGNVVITNTYVSDPPPPPPSDEGEDPPPPPDEDPPDPPDDPPPPPDEDPPEPPDDPPPPPPPSRTTPPPPPDTPNPEPVVVFDDDGTPLGEWKWDDDEWIFEEYVPLGALPTGDASTAVFALLALTAMVGIALVVFKKRKTEEN